MANENINQTTTKEKNSFFKSLNKVFYTYSYIFSPLIVLAIFAVLFSLNNIYPFGDLSVSWCDGDQQFIPLLCDFKDILDGKQGFFLSTANSGGMNFYGVFFFNLSSPFTFLAAFYTKARMPYAFNLMVVLKLATSAVTFSLLLKRKTKNSLLAIFPAVLYAFSGYAMMYYQIAQWLDVFYMFPLVLIGLERITEGKSNVLYIVSLFLCVLFQFYLAYPVIIFVCLYAATQIVYNRADAEKFTVSFIVGSIIAALLSAVVLIPCFLQYTQSMRTSGIIDSLKNSGFIPAKETTFPTFFCLASLFAFAVYAIATDVKNPLVIVFLMTLFPIFIEPIAKAWQTFNYMSFPTRYGFIPITLCIYLAVGAADSAKEGILLPLSSSDDVRKRVIAHLRGKTLVSKIVYGVVLGIFAISLGLFSIAYFNENGEALSRFAQSLWGNATSYKGLLLFAAFTTLFGIVCFLAVKYKMTFKSAVFGAIALLLVFEAVFSCNVYMISAVKFRKPEHNIANEIKSISQLEDLIDDDDYYRVKVSRKLFEVNMIGAMGYNSLSHYTSLNGKNYMMTAKALGYSSYWMEVNSNGGTIFSDALVRNKYIIGTGSSGKIYSTADGKYTITENKILFPSVFVVNNGDFLPDYENYSRWEIQNKFYRKLTGDDGVFTEYAPEKIIGITAKSTASAQIYERTSKIEGDSYLIYNVKCVGRQHLYFDIFDKYTNSLREPTYESVSIRVQKNGSVVKSTSSFPLQSNNGMFDLGEYNDCVITVRITLKKDINAKSFGVFSIDPEKLENAVNRLIGGDFKQINNGFTAKIVSEDGGNMFVAMPYDKGYTATVNGKKREISYFGGFMTVPLDNGENVVEFKFTPKGFSAGLALSLIGLVLFALYIIFVQVKKNATVDGVLSGKLVQKACFLITALLGIFVIVMIYFFPVVVYLIGLF